MPELHKKKTATDNFIKKPDWLRIKLRSAEEYSFMKSFLTEFNLNTICESGKCPNRQECWSEKTATFMILGDVCSRNCLFCNVKKGKPSEVNIEEPLKIAELVNILKLKHCVITSVTRDDLPGGGSGHWAQTIRNIKELNPSTTIEALIPDFQGNSSDIQKVIDEKPEIISHNIETVERLTKTVRIKAEYKTSLDVIRLISASGLISKSGLMLGLGEKEEDVAKAMDDLVDAGCMVLTIGQYLQPSKINIPVTEYITPEEFNRYKMIAMEKGFKFVESGPFVRSSYHSSNHLI